MAPDYTVKIQLPLELTLCPHRGLTKTTRCYMRESGRAAFHFVACCVHTWGTDVFVSPDPKIPNIGGTAYYPLRTLPRLICSVFSVWGCQVLPSTRSPRRMAQIFRDFAWRITYWPTWCQNDWSGISCVCISNHVSRNIGSPVDSTVG
jgi:hypothetical protein